MYNHDYQLTHDMDCFFVLNGIPVHIATNGGIVPTKLGSVEELQSMQRNVANMEGSNKFGLNTSYLFTLNAEEFPSQEDLSRIDVDKQAFGTLFNDSEYSNIPFHWKVYSHSFVEMAKKGFWSFDRIGETPNGIDMYVLVAWPTNIKEGETIHIGHQFVVDIDDDWCKNAGLNRYWELIEIINVAKMGIIDKLNRLTAGQQKHLHEHIGKFIDENLKEIKKLRLVDDALLDDYRSKALVLKGDLYVRKPDASLNNTLNTIYCAAERSITDNHSEGMVSNFIRSFTLRYRQMKNMDESLDIIHSFQGKEIKVEELSPIADSNATIRLEDDVVYIDYSLPVNAQSWNTIQNLSELHVVFDNKQFIAGTGDFYIESTQDDLGETNRFTGKIRINKFINSEFAKDRKAYFRCMIPVGSIDWYRDIHTYATFIRNGWELGLIEFKDGDAVIHVYSCQDGEKKYMVVESLTETTSAKMADYVYSASLTIGFITGNIHLGKCYEFSSTEPEYGKNVVMAYHTMRPSSEASMRIFTTNMYYVRETLKSNGVNLKDKSPLFNQDGVLQEHIQDWLQPNEIQSLFELIQNDAKVARAVVTILESSSFPLEYQASVRAIVLETLARSVEGPKPIPDDELWAIMKSELEAIVSRYAINAAGEQQLSDESMTILRKKINNLNNPTNADSLAKPLEQANYTMTENDKKALKMRDTFLHGGLVKGSLEKQTNELFYLSLMLHKLACIIILKKANFKGYILNNPLLFNCEKAVAADEKPLILI